MTQETFKSFEVELPVWEKAAKRYAKREAARVLRGNVKHVNDYLYEMGRAYQVSVPLDRVNDVLRVYGFNELTPRILCGSDGHLHEDVGHGKWLFLSWHKMETGTYEVIAYVS